MSSNPDPTTAAIVRQLEGLTLYVWRTESDFAGDPYDYGVAQARTLEEAWEHIHRHLRDDLGLQGTHCVYITRCESRLGVGLLYGTEEEREYAY